MQGTDALTEVLNKISTFNGYLSTWESEVERQSLNNATVGELTSLLDWIWRQHNTLRVSRELARNDPQRQAATDGVLRDLDRLESRIRGLSAKNVQKGGRGA
ncbi:hypothetical protein F5Y05DRAFT_413119 [Hypoxylon sp. FL0543]|nr:hypothetical protein F5Y05DRAFT_413119 [Hypoxylon sp. FL0543]